MTLISDSETEGSARGQAAAGSAINVLLFLQSINIKHHFFIWLTKNVDNPVINVTEGSQEYHVCLHFFLVKMF